ncbi:MAG: hypothetical protein EZS28_016728 [Streblomastix strix]|uniref:Uncharacterized protein n=1 Tax=Streblomastix strix TaxID=222440 RepID=A0A5J4VYV6_9EUKA|nr:MAG: hypothetical protein EZS28_016728 [Streblomastix strix]
MENLEQMKRKIMKKKKKKMYLNMKMKNVNKFEKKIIMQKDQICDISIDDSGEEGNVAFAADDVVLLKMSAMRKRRAIQRGAEIGDYF